MPELGPVPRWQLCQRWHVSSSSSFFKAGSYPNDCFLCSFIAQKGCPSPSGLCPTLVSFGWCFDQAPKRQLLRELDRIRIGTGPGKGFPVLGRMSNELCSYGRRPERPPDCGGDG